MKSLIPLLLFAALSACDPCEKLDCLNDGKCVNGFCKCTDFWTGDVCEQKILDLYLGNYVGKSNCKGSMDFETIQFLANNSQSNTLKMSDGTDEFVLDFTTYSSFLTDTLVFVDPDFGTYEKSGSGVITGTSIEMKMVYYYEADSTSVKCSFVGKK